MHGRLHPGDRQQELFVVVAARLADRQDRRHRVRGDHRAPRSARDAAHDPQAFADRRTTMPMNIRASYPGKGMTPQVRADIERITGLWRDCRKRFAGAAGAKDEGFLFGTISAADAMYTPVATRLRTYGVKLDSDAEAYCNAVLGYAPMKQWIADAKNEPWLIQQYE